MSDGAPAIHEQLARRLIDAQFPQWRDLAVAPVPDGGVDNRTFRLGDDLLVRLPSHARYVPQVEKEQLWLPVRGRQSWTGRGHSRCCWWRY